MVDVGRVIDADMPALLLAGAHTIVLHDRGGRAGSEQVGPEWTIVVPCAGHVEWWIGQCPGGRAPGVIFPPRVAYIAHSTGGHVSMLIDAWFEELGPGRRAAVALDRQAAEHLRGLWSRADVAALDESARETVIYLRQRDILPSEGAIDPRVAAALRDLPAGGRVDQLAAGVGLCPSRLRALIKDLTGMPPTRLRMWQRLRAAMLSLPDKPIAVAAADAGFADQAHLTRTASRLVGRTPGELARILPGPRTEGRASRQTASPEHLGVRR